PIELRLQLSVVLDDAVEDDRDLRRVAAGERMCILLRDAAVRGPARMPETMSGRRSVRAGGRDEILEIAHRAHVVEPVVLAQRDARGVVAAVLEALQPLQQERLRLTLSHVSDDPAHSASEMERARLSDRSAASRDGQPSSSLTSRTSLPQRASAS